MGSAIEIPLSVDASIPRTGGPHPDYEVTALVLQGCGAPGLLPGGHLRGPGPGRYPTDLGCRISLSSTTMNVAPNTRPSCAIRRHLIFSARLPYMDAIRWSTGHSERRPNGVRRSPSMTHTPQRILRGSNFFELLVKVS